MPATEQQIANLRELIQRVENQGLAQSHYLGDDEKRCVLGHAMEIAGVNLATMVTTNVTTSIGTKQLFNQAYITDILSADTEIAQAMETAFDDLFTREEWRDLQESNDADDADAVIATLGERLHEHAG